MTSRFSSILNDRLSHITNGKSFHDWCEGLIDIIPHQKVPIDLTEYFEARKIKGIETDRNLSFPAQLIKKREGFFIKVNRPVDYNNNSYDRFLIAHEIAHTFQYTFKDELIEERSFFLPGSIEAEYFGNRLARNILIPRKFLLNKFSELNLKIENDFSFELLRDLSILFNISHVHLLTRIINDLDLLPNAAVFRFIKPLYNNQWRLYSKHVANMYENKKYFIPKGHKTDLSKQYVSVGENLNQYLTELYEKLQENHVKTEIYLEMLNDKPLTTFIKNFLAVQSYPGLIGKTEVFNGSLINIFVNLKNK